MPTAHLHAITDLARDIRAFELRPADAQAWPPATAGAHIDLHLPNGLTRSYSLLNAPGETHRYIVAVRREPAGRGGSAYLHDQARAGQTIEIGTPRNHFPLNESARHSVLIAGGIGITPLWAMAQRLSRLGARWTLHYAARAPEHAALWQDAVALGQRTGNDVRLHFDDGDPSRGLDLAGLVMQQADTAHLYCCGPSPMLQAFEQACSGRDGATVHREYFAAAPNGASPGDTGFRLHLARSGLSLSVEPDASVLDTLAAAGIRVASSCLNGICGTCEVGVLSGVPDHRDLVLSDAERAAGKTMLACCSRAKTPEMTLDL